ASGQVCGQRSGENFCKCVPSDETCSISQAPTCGGTCPALVCCPNGHVGQVCGRTQGGNSCDCVCPPSTCPFVTKWGTQGSGDGQFNRPAAVAVDGRGKVYVAGYDNNSIEKLTCTGN